MEHGIQISKSTLKRRLKDMNLARKNVNYDTNLVRQTIEELLDWPKSSVGCRSMWQNLTLRCIVIPCLIAQQLMQQLDSEGVQERKAYGLRRRQYHSPGPNRVWHADGYDKLKPYGFPLHGCIDGYTHFSTTIESRNVCAVYPTSVLAILQPPCTFIYFRREISVILPWS